MKVPISGIVGEAGGVLSARTRRRTKKATKMFMPTKKESQQMGHENNLRNNSQCLSQLLFALW